MFYYFFEEYKKKVYKESLTKLKWYEVVMIGFLILVLLLLILSSALNWSIAIIISLIILLLMALIIMVVYSNKKFTRNLDALLNKYKNQRIDPLIKLLEKFSLHNNNGIDWLIDCCEGKKNTNDFADTSKSIQNIFLTIVCPLVTLSIGIILKENSADEIISFIIFIIVLFFAVAFFIFFIKPNLSFLLYPDRNIVNYLENDLKYLKTQLTK